MKMKDEEIRLARQEKQKGEEEKRKLTRHLQSLQFEVDILRLHLAELEKSVQNKSDLPLLSLSLS